MTAEANTPDPLAHSTMLRAVHERHPEVNIVVLPGDVPAPHEPVVSPLVLEDLHARLDAYTEQLIARLASHDDMPTPERRTVPRVDDVGRDYIELRAYAGNLAEGVPVALLRATAQAWVRLGWQVRPVPGTRPRVEARTRTEHAVFRATATVRPDALMIHLRTPSVRTRQLPGPAGSAS